MRSGRTGLSEYTSQRLAELQALRKSNDSNDRDQRDKKGHYYDEVLGSSSGKDDGSCGVAPSRPTDSSSMNRITLPSAMLESKSGTSSRVGYTSLALPPDGSYRPLPSSLYGRENYEAYTRLGNAPVTENTMAVSTTTGITPGNTMARSTTARSTIDLLPPFTDSHVNYYTEAHTGSLGKNEIRRKLSLGNMDDGKKSLAIKTDDGCIGFATLPDQVHRKAIKRGFDFTIMVVGESGLGKSTLISSMFFQDDIYKDRITVAAKEKITKTVQVEKRHLDIEEHGVKLRVTIVDTPGFNDALNATDSWKAVNKYIVDQFEQFFRDESGINRQAIQDNRVHCCLYFISPYGRGLRPVDVDFMKRLHGRVNIVPIIAKADALTPNELKQLKCRVMDEIRKHNIQIYELPPTDNDEDEDFIRKDKEMKAAYPFAVIGGNAVIEVDGKRVKGRVYPWGIVEAENPQFSNVAILRQFLVSTHLQDLKEVTKDVHYENFRASLIDENANTVSLGNNAKEVAAKLLMEKEAEIKRMHMVLQKMQSQMYQGHIR